MKTKFKISNRLLSLVLALVMVLGMMPGTALTAHAAEPITLSGNTFSDPGNGFYFSVNALCNADDCNVSVQVNSQNGTTTNTNGNHSFTITSFSYNISAGKATWSYSCSYTTCQGSGTFTYTVSDRAFTCTDELHIGPSVRTSDSLMYVSVWLCRPSSTHQGDATCKTAANCTLCGTSYTNASNHEKPDEFTYSVNTSDSTKHDKKYACCGAVSETATHSDFTYSLNGNMFTKTCGICGHAATATLTADDAVYTGTPITAASITYSDGWQGEEKQPAEIADTKYINNTNAGTATVTTTVEGKELTTTFQITAADIADATVTIDPASRPYTGARHNYPDYSLTYNSKSLTLNTDYTAGEWSGNFLDAGTYTLELTGKGNFTGTKTITYTINKADSTADLFQFELPQNAAYNGTAYSATVTSGASGLGAFTVKYNGSTDAPVNAGTYKVTVDVAAGSNYNAASGIELGSFTIAPTDGSATVSIEGWEYGDTAKTPVPVSTTNGTDNVTYQYKVKDADDSTYTSTVPTAVGSYTVKATFAATQNHKEVTATADFAISKRTVTVTADDAGKTYGGAEPELTWKVTSGSELANEKLSINISRAEGEDAGDYTITVSQTEDANPNYNITFVPGTFTIEQAKLTITADNIGITYGDAAPTYTVTYSGFVNGDDKDDLGGILAFDCDYAQFADKGTYTITPSGYESGNYDISYIDGTLTVNPKPITVTITDKTSVYGKEIVTLTATDNGIVNNDENVYSLATTATKTSNAGEYPITGTALDGNYAITFVDGTYTITKAPVNSIGTDMTVAYTAGMEVDLRQMFSIDENAGAVDYWITHLTGEGSFTSAPYLYRIDKAGTFTVKITTEETANYNSGVATAVLTVNPGDPGIGAVTAGVVNDTLETSAIVLTRANTDVNGNLTVDAGQTLALGENKIAYTFTPDDTINYKVVTGEVTVTVKDTIAPTGTVTISTNSWNQFLNDITFGLFFKKTQEVSVTATDNLSGVAKIEYIESATAMDLDAVKVAQQWTETKNGKVSVTLEDTKQFIYYIRITDKSGNIAYLSSDGAEYDITAPVIEGVNNGATYYTTQTVTVTDKNIDSITLNGEAATGSITLDGNKDATYTIEVIDKAGNKTTVTVTMKPIKEVAAATENITNGNVTSANEQALEDLVAKLDELLADPDLTDGERETLEQHKHIAESLLETIEDTKAEIARINEELNKYDGNTVNSDDAAALEQLGKDIKALTDGDNLTDAERTALTEDADDVAAMQKTVADTKAENDRISDAVDGYDLATVTSDDKADLEQLLADINEQLQSTNLTDEEISELNGDKKAVEDLLTKIKGTDELIDKLTEDVDGYSEDTVKSTDKDAIEQIIEDIDALLETENLTDAEEKALEDAKAKAEGLLDTIEDAAEATTSENTEKVKDVTAENVTPEDKTDLEKANEDLEKALEDNGGNYTDDEKKAIEDEIKRIDDALEVIENVEEVEELIGKLPENISKNDEDAIKAADDAYNALSDYEKSLVDADAKKALDEAKAALAELNKPADTNSPQTGDNSNMFLWIALLFISGGAVITLTVVDRKRRTAANK